MEKLIEQLEGEMEGYGITLGKDNANTLRKCASLCTKYDMDSEEFVDSWVAYAATKSIPELEIKHLDGFERQELSSRKESKKKVLPTTAAAASEFSYGGRVQVFGDSSVADLDLEQEDNYDAVDNVLEAYGVKVKVGTPRLNNKQPVTRLRELANNTPKSDFSPLGYSPMVNSKSTTYGSRTKAGDTLLHYKCKDSEYWKEIPGRSSTMKVVSTHDSPHWQSSQSSFRYMFQKTTDTATTFNSVVEDLGLDAMSEGDLEPQDLRISSGEESWYLGRIRNDDGRLSQGSALLEGDMEISGGHVVSLDLSAVDEYRLFPGQVVLIKGKNELGKCIRVTGVSLPPPLPLKDVEQNSYKPLNIIVACGPYTPVDSLQCEPLLDLLEVIKLDNPDLCILMGPFIDPTHPLISEVADTYDDMFENMVGRMYKSLENATTRVVLVSSFKDAHQHPVYPTPEYSIPLRYMDKITVLPDPSTLEVAGITIGLTSVDILKHLANSEIAKSTIMDRMGGLSKSLISQRNFYPLYPPDESVPLDIPLWFKYCKFTITPHIVILPSDLRFFIKEVEGAIVVNPERLTKGKSGGTYARLQVKLPEQPESMKCIADFCCGEIKKI